MVTADTTPNPPPTAAPVAVKELSTIDPSPLVNSGFGNAASAVSAQYSDVANISDSS